MSGTRFCPIVIRKSSALYSPSGTRRSRWHSVGLEYLVPLALEQLQEDPFAEGAYFPGDLLVSVLGANGEFWQAHPDLREHAATVAERAISL